MSTWPPEFYNVLLNVSIYAKFDISGCYVKSEPEDFKYSTSSYEPQYYGEFTVTRAK